MFRQASQAAQVVMMTDESGIYDRLAQILCRTFRVTVIHAAEKLTPELAREAAVALADAQMLASLGVEARSPLFEAESYWMLFAKEDAVDSAMLTTLASRLYHIVRAPWRPEEIAALVERAAEHYHLRRAYQQLAQGDRAEQSWGAFIQTEKMATLGQMVAGLVHEINTPSGAMNAASVNMSHHLALFVKRFEELLQQSFPATELPRLMRIAGEMLDALQLPRRTTEEIRTEQKRLTDILKQHHISESYKFAKEIARMGLAARLDELLALSKNGSLPTLMAFFLDWYRIIHSAQDIRLSNDMLTRIIRAVKFYAYPWQETPEFADIHESLTLALTLLANSLKRNIRVLKSFAALPQIYCYPGDLSHVWINLLQNAIQAMNGRGDIRIDTFLTDAFLGVSITDSGCGIPAAIQPKIFDMSFTTKPRGEGTGLGLFIARQIVEKHGGTIHVASVPGNTTFEVRFPRQLAETPHRIDRLSPRP